MSLCTIRFLSFQASHSSGDVRRLTKIISTALLPYVLVTSFIKGSVSQETALYYGTWIVFIVITRHCTGLRPRLIQYENVKHCPLPEVNLIHTAFRNMTVFPSSGDTLSFLWHICYYSLLLYKWCWTMSNMRVLNRCHASSENLWPQQRTFGVHKWREIVRLTAQQLPPYGRFRSTEY